MIQLVGPGGAGKTTTGAALAKSLGVRFVDLDAEFAARHGDISDFLDAHGYDVYARHNVDLFLSLVDGPVRPDVVALSSGFMTYRDSVHPDYPELRQRVASSLSTFVLLPSVDLETCVTEIVRRQRHRHFARTAEREELVIRDRFASYLGLSARKVETMQPVDAVVDELAQRIHDAAPGVSLRRSPHGEGASSAHALAMTIGRYSVRAARRHDLAQLPRVEHSASQRFRASRYPHIADEIATSVEEFTMWLERGALWVAVDASDAPVGFAIAHELDGQAYLHEIDVDPAHGGQGVGRLLIAHISEWAVAQMYDRLMLSTFADVPWNAPYYRRLGFVGIDDADVGPGLREVRRTEQDAGLNVARRVFMFLAIGRPN